MSVDEENSNSTNSEKSYNPERSREWFGVQLESPNLRATIRMAQAKVQPERQATFPYLLEDFSAEGVINLLLEAERRKLCVLQRELKTALEEGGSIKAKEHQKQELITAIHKIQLQYDNLEKECRQHAIGALKASNTRGTGKKNRSRSRLLNEEN
ncbi:hypothetical protein RUM44_004448 [Polyplax serrata]|uniref:Uncharacterized protein n=1 Tax=Polyplax serrata TaxID=468196 RepID=A0ABR1B3L4_POLSC